MGTPNFARPSNASKYFVVLTGREEKYKECPECKSKHYEWEHTLEELKECDLCKEDLTNEDIQEEYVYPDEWEADDLIENIGCNIKEIGGVKENEWIGNDRNYGMQSLGYLEESKDFGDVNVNVVVKAVIQNAYYEGATLDYLIYIEDQYNGEFKHSTGSYYDEDIDSILETVFDEPYTDMNVGMRKIQARYAEKWAEQTIAKLSEKIEAIFEVYSEHKLGRTGVFSNGEAIYHKVD